MKNEFEYFKEMCVKWQKKLGLIDWDIEYEIEELYDVYAKVSYSTTSRTALVRLSSDWNGKERTQERIERTALHEMLELLFADIDNFLYKELGEEISTTETHKIIRTLENVLLEVR